jgi:N-acetylglucosaminyldiphosphoundecaprenol N-acetyl-beta-D-mannosaminyltransferase
VKSATAAGPPGRTMLGHLPLDPVTMGGALEIVERLVGERGGAVFTPNVDHIVQAEDDERFREAYARVDLSLADGMPVIWASRLLRSAVREKVSGSDFVPVLLERAAERGWRVYFLGGRPGVAALARDKLRERLPALEVVGVDDSRVEVDDVAGRTRLVGQIRATRPQIVLVALGAPKQELWIDQVRESLSPVVFVAVGASLDFVAGATSRAPRWMSQNGLEWLYRLAQEPGRLSRRYFLRDPRFAAVVARELLARRRRKRDGAP